MNLNDYFSPVSLDKPDVTYLNPENTLSRYIDIHTPDNPIQNIDQYTIAIIGVPESRGSINKGTDKACDQVRKKLYQLTPPTSRQSIIDLGNIYRGNTLNDTIYALRDVYEYINQHNLTVLFIGGGQHLVYSSFLLYTRLNKRMNLVTIDAKLDLDESRGEINSENYLKTIIKEDKKNILFDFTNLGHQVFYNNNNELDFLKKHLYESKRLGDLKNNLHEAEPYLRDANILSIDCNAIRQSDCPANLRPSPNGFYGEEICQFAKYAGMSNNMNAIWVNEINPDFDINGQGAHLMAQALWYFIQGAEQRIYENPWQSNDFKKFIVNFNVTNHEEIIFYKSSISERWWVEVPSKNQKKLMLACSYKDYENACNHEIPERWLRFFQKIN